MTTTTSWNRLRKLVKTRDKAICYYCKQKADDGHCDHVIPLSKGGTDSIDNLVWACPTCNLQKGSKILLDMEKEEVLPDWLASIPDYQSLVVLPQTFDEIVKKSIHQLLLFAIPPYPIYRQKDYPSYDLYFWEIIDYKSRKIEDWFRKLIWNTPTDVQIIDAQLETYKGLIKRISKYHLWSPGKPIACPECSKPISFENQLNNTINYTCPLGHKGSYIIESFDCTRKELFLIAISWSKYSSGYSGIPFTLGNLEPLQVIYT